MSNSDGQPNKSPAVQSAAISNRDLPEMKNELPKKKDAWDKAQIVSGFLSSVVIAGVGILINIAIQRAQINASEASTRAQIEVTERNNKAQLALTERTAEIQRHLQEGTLTEQPVEHLTGASSLKKRLAIVVLRRSIPPDMYQDVITVIVKSDTDPNVRKTALEQARTLQGVAPSVVEAISQAALDATRPGGSALSQRTPFVNLVCNRPRQRTRLRSILVREKSVRWKVRGLSRPLVYALLTARAFGRGQPQKGRECSDIGTQRVRETQVIDFTQGRQHPGVMAPVNGADPIIVGPGAKYSKIISVAIGNQDCKDEAGPLRFAGKDAQSFAEFWRNHGASSRVMINASKDQMLRDMHWATSETDSDFLGVFYYSGQAFTDTAGATWLFPVDGDVDHVAETGISAANMRDILFKSSARTNILFLDTSFSGSLLATR